MAGLTGSWRLGGERRGAAAIIILTWATVVMPSLIQSYTMPKARYLTSDVPSYSHAAALVNLFVTVALTFGLLLLLARHLRQLPVDRRGVLIILLLPWLYQVSRDLYAGTPLKLGGLLYPLIVVVIWVLRPRLSQLAILGYLVGLTALISVLMGALDPARGILLSATTAGSIVTPEKEILPWGILIGPLTDGNPLGQFLALGLPSAMFIRNRPLRWSIVVITAFAVLWTSNRSSLAALAVGLLVAGLIKLSPQQVRRVTVTVLLAIAGAVVVYLPISVTSNSAFTNRGYIWRASLSHWRENPLLGLGSQWYSQSARYENNIGPTAYHGHNQFVQTLVLGGLLNLALTVLMLVTIARFTARWAEFHGVKVPAAFLAMVLTSGTLEVSLSFVHRSFLLPVTGLAIAYICFAREDRPPALPVEPIGMLYLDRPGPLRPADPSTAEGESGSPSPETVAAGLPLLRSAGSNSGSSTGSSTAPDTVAAGLPMARVLAAHPARVASQALPTVGIPLDPARLPKPKPKPSPEPKAKPNPYSGAVKPTAPLPEPDPRPDPKP